MEKTYPTYYEYDWEDEVLIKIPHEGLPKIFYRKELKWRDFNANDESYDRAICLGQGCWERLRSIEEEEALQILKDWEYQAEHGTPEKSDEGNSIKERETGNQDQKELNRTLTEAEQKRLAAFEAQSEKMKGQGYRRVDLTVSIVKANIFAVILLFPVLALGFWLFWLKNGFPAEGFTPKGIGGLILFVIVMVVLVVVHELIHGLSWSLFTPRRFRDIEFGFMKQYLTPYCTCLTPLTKGQYVFGALMPLVLLGILPMAAGILAGSMPVLFMGIIMTVSAAGDIMIVWSLLTYRSQAEKIVYMDHPTQAGGVIFEK